MSVKLREGHLYELLDSELEKVKPKNQVILQICNLVPKIKTYRSKPLLRLILNNLERTKGVDQYKVKSLKEDLKQLS